MPANLPVEEPLHGGGSGWFILEREFKALHKGKTVPSVGDDDDDETMVTMIIIKSNEWVHNNDKELLHQMR